MFIRLHVVHSPTSSFEAPCVDKSELYVNSDRLAGFKKGRTYVVEGVTLRSFRSILPNPLSESSTVEVLVPPLQAEKNEIVDNFPQVTYRNDLPESCSYEDWCRLLKLDRWQNAKDRVSMSSVE